jgi:hypothetical protein
MSREKMLQAQVALKNEQLANMTKEVEQLRRQAEESGKRARKLPTRAYQISRS